MYSFYDFGGKVMIVDLSPYENKEEIELLRKNLPSSNIFVMLPYIHYLLQLFKSTDDYTRISMFNFNSIDVSLKSGPLFLDLTGIYGLDIVINPNILLDKDNQIILYNLSLYSLNLSYLKLYICTKYFKVFDFYMFINRNMMGDVCVELIDDDYSSFCFPLDYQLLNNIIIPDNLTFTNDLFIGNLDLLNNDLSLYSNINIYIMNSYLLPSTIYHIVENCLTNLDLVSILNKFNHLIFLFDSFPSSYEYLTLHLCEFIKRNSITNLYFRFSPSYLEECYNNFNLDLKDKEKLENHFKNLFSYLSLFDNDYLKIFKDKLLIE